MSERKKGAKLVVPRDVMKLLEERSKVQGWLAKLKELGETSTPQVLDRVSSDYRGRLDVVSAQLLEHREALEDSVSAHAAAVQELQGERESAAWALEEAELRFRVGEYGETEWDSHREDRDHSMKKVDAQLAEEEAALVELKTVLDELVSGQGRLANVSSPDVAEEVTSEPAVSEENQVMTDDAVAESEGKPAESDEEGREYLDELEFLESLSLDDAEAFDAVSLLLDEPEEEGEEKPSD